jgi:hypothetical protein
VGQQRPGPLGVRAAGPHPRPQRAVRCADVHPYIVDGARWIRDNRSEFGPLHSGWSAEHLGEKDKPHYWDDFWGVAGLYEAARLADRLGTPQAAELWGAYHDLRHDLEASIRWVLDRQREAGRWETFIATGPADVNRLDSFDARHDLGPLRRRRRLPARLRLAGLRSLPRVAARARIPARRRPGANGRVPTVGRG